MLFIFLTALSAFAIEGLPCQRALTGSGFKIGSHVFELAPNQVVYQGRLEMYLDPPVSTVADWSIADTFLSTTLADSALEALRKINPGDHVFLLDTFGEPWIMGFHGETRARSDDYFYNQPHFLKSPGIEERELKDEIYRALFHHGQSAVVISTLRADEMQKLEDRYGPKLRALADTESSASRFVTASSRDSLVWMIQPIVEDNRLSGSAFDKALQAGDILVLIGNDENTIGTIEVRDLPVILAPQALKALAVAKQCLVVRKVPRRL